MFDDFTPRLDILPSPQRRLWDELAAVPDEFVLCGGTAMALHLGHRTSVHFDFFGNRPLDPAKLAPAVPFLAGAIVTQRAPNTFICTVDRGGVVKLSFFGLPDIPRLTPPLIAPDNGLQVASLLDLAATKASVVQMRAEAKDYVDIDALLMDGRVDLPTAIAAARAIYGAQFNPQSTLKALSYFDDGNLRRLPRAVRIAWRKRRATSISICCRRSPRPAAASTTIGASRDENHSRHPRDASAGAPSRLVRRPESGSGRHGPLRRLRAGWCDP